MARVSMIVPCYNVSAVKLDRFFHSVCQQRYPDLEVLIVDDGSTDDTCTRMMKWGDHLAQQGLRIHTFTKSHGGVASAINMALGHVSGDYLCFPDADDILSPDYVSAMAEVLDSRPEVNWVRCRGQAATHSNLEALYGTADPAVDYRPDRLLEEFLLMRIDPVAWLNLVRTDYLISCIPDMCLHENEGHQEWQITLPLAFYGTFHLLNKSLYTHIYYPDSTIQSMFHRPDAQRRYMDLVRESQEKTLDKLPLSTTQRKRIDDIRTLGWLKLLYAPSTMMECSYQLCDLFHKTIGVMPKQPPPYGQDRFELLVGGLESFFLHEQFL